MEHRVPAVGNAWLGGPSQRRAIGIGEQPPNRWAVDGVDEAMLAVAAPVHEIGRPPASLALDAVLGVDDELHFTLPVDARFVDVGGANMPETLLHHFLPRGQRAWPEQIDVRFLDGLVGELTEPPFPALRRSGDERGEVGSLRGGAGVAFVEA